jgi:hypothetical protein
MWFPALLAWVGGEQVSGIDPLTGGRGGGDRVAGRPRAVARRGCRGKGGGAVKQRKRQLSGTGGGDEGTLRAWDGKGL